MVAYRDAPPPPPSPQHLHPPAPDAAASGAGRREAAACKAKTPLADQATKGRRKVMTGSGQETDATVAPPSEAYAGSAGGDDGPRYDSAWHSGSPSPDRVPLPSPKLLAKIVLRRTSLETSEQQPLPSLQRQQHSDSLAQAPVSPSHAIKEQEVPTAARAFLAVADSLIDSRLVDHEAVPHAQRSVGQDEQLGSTQCHPRASTSALPASSAANDTAAKAQPLQRVGSLKAGLAKPTTLSSHAGREKASQKLAGAQGPPQQPTFKKAAGGSQVLVMAILSPERILVRDRALFMEHLPAEVVDKLIQVGEAHKGMLHVNVYNQLEAYVTIEGLPLDVLILGDGAQNRAMEGDIVAVQLDSPSDWPLLKGTPANNKTEAARPNGIHSPPGRIHPLLGARRPEDANGTGRLPSQQITNSDSRTHAKYAASSQDLAQLLLSMPGRRPSGRVVAILEPSPRRDSLVGYLDLTKFWNWHSRRHKILQNSGCCPSGSEGSPVSTLIAVDGSGEHQGGCLPSVSEGKLNGGGYGSPALEPKYGLFVPADMRLPKLNVCLARLPEDLYDRLQGGDTSLSQTLFAASVDTWSRFSSIPQAVVKHALGQAGEIEAESAAIVYQHKIHSVDFPSAVLACLPPKAWHISNEEVARRKDLRHLRIFTIDPPTARDLDDALSVEKLANGNISVGVHIADVSFFVKPGSALDEEARQRSTSVYLIQRVLPMLPPSLCEELCSLNPGVDRLAFSIIWEMTLEGAIKDQWIGRTVIRSCCKLSYNHAQEMIDGGFAPNRAARQAAKAALAGCDSEDAVKGSFKQQVMPRLHPPHSWPEVVGNVQLLFRISKMLRERRFASGALKLDTVKLSFALDDSGSPSGISAYQSLESNNLVEEFMLLANMTAARAISLAFPEAALLRRHPRPNDQKLAALIAFCEKNGLRFDSSTSASIHESLVSMREDLRSDPELFEIVMNNVVKPMQLASYFCTGNLKDQEDWRHYALNCPYYTHFTSPIRRYPDVLVHRMLAAALDAEARMCDSGILSQRNTSRLLKDTHSGRCFTCLQGQATPTLSDRANSAVARQQAASAAESSGLLDQASLSQVASHANVRKLASRQAQEASSKLYLCVMLKKLGGLLAKGRVVGLGPTWMTISVPKLGLERRVAYKSLDGVDTQWFEATGTLVLSASASSKSGYGENGRSHRRGRALTAMAGLSLATDYTDGFTPEDWMEEADTLLLDEDNSSDSMEAQQRGMALRLLDQREVVEPAVFPLTLRLFSAVPVLVRTVGGYMCPMDVSLSLHVMSYLEHFKPLQ
eukprot:SM000111S18822  [mRNA]  locus=s111:296390:301205:- [translate_table: standard]